MMTNWLIEYNDWNPAEHPLREALCTLGNGYMATRGAMEELGENSYNYPGTYLAGGYNRAVSRIREIEVVNEDLVNWPNWLPLKFRINGSAWIDPGNMKIIDYKITLNLMEGILERKMRFIDERDRVTRLISRRFVSMHDAHSGGIEWSLIPENWEGLVTINTGIDGNVSNNGVERYKDLNGEHLEILETGNHDVNAIYLTCCTKQSKILMAMSSLTRLFSGGKELQCPRITTHDRKSVWQDIQAECIKGRPLTVQKLVVVYTSRDFAITDPVSEASAKTNYLVNFNDVIEKHKEAWAGIWERGGIDIDTGGNELLILRLHIFHLYQTVSANSIDCDTGVPARGWHGEAYRGHIFWDELYIFSYINLHLPQLARSLLMYRYRRLPRARLAARENGYRGAMFPWQSGSNGREESQVIHLNPHSGRWVSDNTYMQRHINAAIVYNIWQYYQATQDTEFMVSYGAEIIFNSALFWSTIATHDRMSDRYEIKGVVGPDEYHTGYPGSDNPGLNNNAYTNFMAAWVMRCATDLSEYFNSTLMHEYAGKVGFTEKDLQLWKEIPQKMFIPFLDNNIILQFDGFDKLKDLDWKKYRSRYGNTMRLDRILEQEKDSVNNYRICKQADVLMLFYLFSSEKLIEMFSHMGYNFKPESIPENIEYYTKITSHGSTLSQVIFAWVSARSDRKTSWARFKNALRSDFEDIQGGTTPEGIHLGAMAGTVDLVQRCYTGLEIRDDVLWLNPNLPAELKEINLQLNYRSHWINLKITHNRLIIGFIRGWSNPVEINVRGKSKLFSDNGETEIMIKN